MVFVETSVFTRRIQALMSDDDYGELQSALRADPLLGALIAGTGGLRKLRWARPGKGRRGGARVIYYWFSTGSQFYMLLAYAKNEQDDLTPEQASILRRLVREEFDP